MKKINIETLLKRVSLGLSSVALMAVAVACSSDEPGNNDNDEPGNISNVSKPMEGLNEELFSSWDEVTAFADSSIPTDMYFGEGAMKGAPYVLFHIVSSYGTEHFMPIITYNWKFLNLNLKNDYEVPACGGDFKVDWFIEGKYTPEVSQIFGWFSDEKEVEQYTYDYVASSLNEYSSYHLPYTNYWDFTDEDRAEIVEVVDENWDGPYAWCTLRIPENKIGKKRRLFVVASFWKKADQFSYPLEIGEEYEAKRLFSIVQMP